MLHLFKLPFNGSFFSKEKEDYTANLFNGVLTNYRKQRQDLTEEEFDRACDLATREMESLQQQLQSTNKEEHYDLITASLRRLEAQLK